VCPIIKYNVKVITLRGDRMPDNLKKKEKLDRTKISKQPWEIRYSPRRKKLVKARR